MKSGEIFEMPSEGDLKLVEGAITWFINGENVDKKGFSVYQFVDGEWDGLCPLADFSELFPFQISRLPHWAIDAGKKEKLSAYGFS